MRAFLEWWISISTHIMRSFKRSFLANLAHNGTYQNHLIAVKPAKPLMAGRVRSPCPAS